MQNHQVLSNKLRQNIAAMLDVMFLHSEQVGIIHYLVAATLVGLAVLVRLAIAPFNDGIPFLTFFPAATLAAVLGGMGPGMFATALGMIVASYMFIPPYYSFSFEIQAEVMCRSYALTGNVKYEV